ncbi:dimethylamine monooxygenase subunit DmmA family protein [Cypionkella psychrotolerans]|uniref:dimethylamine monooxygenase subunit DmmA family protein n=1 Tax=Cypionkella psychrotolerans TaxID=1678131 RepID=UPI0006B490E8|nr:dimethylamine monooxygenase subunit DmmA family protein [Cypionkella psychrotolerans]
MTKTMFEPSITSRPVYGVLSPGVGSAHLFVADGEGAEAVCDLFAKAEAAEMKSASHIIYMPGANGCDRSAALQALGVAQFYRAPSFASAQPRLAKVLADAHMGLQVYAAGTEGLMAQVATAAQAAGLPYEAVQMEHRGSLARRVQCVHCKGVTENVTLDPFVCSHCGLSLFVRDHFSRRIAAFQGVNIDAEDPGLVPASVERFK